MLVSDRPFVKGRIGVFAAIVFAAQTVLLISLWRLQLSKGEVYTERLRQQTTVAIRLPSARGIIEDRNGLPLAENRSSFDVDFYLDELQRNYSRAHRGRLPYVEISYKRRGVEKKRKEVDIVKIVNEAVGPVAETLGFKNRPDEKELREHYRIRRDVPYQFRTDVDFATLARFSEHNLGVPGIEILARPVRYYRYGSLASHIIGYVGKPDDQSQALAEDGSPYETIGKQGIEALMDPQMQGRPGGKLLRVNYRGYVDREEKMRQPTLGNSIKLTIDARIQYVVEQAMRGVGRGTAVVMDPNTGDVLALVSIPNYDPNHFVPKIAPKEWRELNSDPTSPLVNRALEAYPPGSTYKVLVALAALKSKTIKATDKINCPGVVEIAGHPFKDWNPNGQGIIDMKEALKMSCNTYFYQVGVRTGDMNIAALGQLAGFGQKTDFALGPEKTGILPSREWMKQQPKLKGYNWTSAYTANMSIGQGFVLVTPLQMVTFMSAVANGGTIYRPRLISEITSPDGAEVVKIPEKQERSNLEVNPEDLTAVKEGLLAVVDGGTGKRGGIPGVKVAGKTGTAQFKRRMHGEIIVDNKTWFYGFAPYDTPRYAFIVMVEGGVAGGTTCAPVASEILKGIFALEKQGAEIAMNYLPSVAGHFRGVSEVSTGGSIVSVPGEPAPSSTTDSGTSPDGEVPVAAPATAVEDEVPTQGDVAPEPIREDAEPPKIMPKRRF